MTRVCVTWDREETARLVTRCREKLAVSEGIASAIHHEHRVWWVDPDSDFDPVVVSEGSKAGGVWCEVCEVGQGDEEAAHIAANDPSTRLALNRALTVVLDGVAATLGKAYDSRLQDVAFALLSLAAIAEALGVQEEGR